MAPINIDADLGVRGFLKGTKDMETALESVSDELDDVAKSGENDVERLADKLKEADKAAKALKDSGSDIGKGVKKGTVEAEDATEVYKKEAIANVSEVTSSFTGSWESAVDVVQGTLGGVVADLGKFGAVAAAGAAIGVGVIGEVFRQMEEKAKEAEARVSELAQAFIDAGSGGKVPLETAIENLKNITTNSENARVKFKDLKVAADKIGISAESLASAYAGGNEELEKQLTMLRMLQKQTIKNNEAAKAGATEFNVQSFQKLSEINNQIKALEDLQKENQAAADAEAAFLDTGGGQWQAKKDLIEGINGAYDDVVGSVQDYVDEETGLLDITAFVKAIDDRKKALANYQTDIATLGLSTEQKKALNDMGVDAAMQYLDGIKRGTPAQAEFLKQSLTEAASAASGVAKDKLDLTFKQPTKTEIVPEVNTFSADIARRTIEDIAKTQKVKIELEVSRKNIFGQDVP